MDQREAAPKTYTVITKVELVSEIQRPAIENVHNYELFSSYWSALED